MRRLLATLALVATPVLPAAPTVITVTDDVILASPRRLGINAGARSQWGEAQILKNLVDNPGFEGGLYGTVFHAAAGATANRVEADFWDTAWNNDQYAIGMPEGFWTGAAYEIVFGPAASRAGTISGFTHENGHYTFHLDGSGAAPQRWDVLFARRAMASPEWAAEPRPGSPGVQSRRLRFLGEAWQSDFQWYMDSFWRDSDRTAGKLFLVRGPWRLRLWARGNRDGALLRVRFFREGEATFFEETIALTTAWQEIVRDFTVPGGADTLGDYTVDEYHPLIGFLMGVPSAGDEVFVDDLEIARSDHANPTVFTDAFVERLRTLRPGVLRDWKTSDFGNTLENLIAPPFARRRTGHRPHEREASQWGYSMHEFFELCREIGAEPWQVIPPTLAPEDLPALVEYLAAPADGAHPWADRRAALGQTAPWTDVFPQIHIEFGNELWGSASGGDPFMGASLLGGERLGRIAHDRFALLRAHPLFDDDEINLIIGGQAGFPGRQQEIEANSTHHRTLALAPYFGILDTHATEAEIYGPLFARPVDDVTAGRVRESWNFLQSAGHGTGLAIYEINFHTTHPGPPIDLRNDYLTGAGGAVALPLHMLHLMRAFRCDLQAAFSALGFAFRLENGDHARLWGMLRDLEATGRARPTWLGVELANRAIAGDLVTAVHSGDDPIWHQPAINGISAAQDVPLLQSFAFRDGERGSVIVFNLSLTQTLPAVIDLPRTPPSTATLHRIATPSLHDDNEDAETVSIQTSEISGFADGHALDLPPHSVTAIVWPGESASLATGQGWR